MWAMVVRDLEVKCYLTSMFTWKKIKTEINLWPYVEDVG